MTEDDLDKRRTKLAPDHCPVCRTRLDTATGLDGRRPRPGDLSFCIECLSYLRFGRNMKLEVFKGEPPRQLVRMREIMIEVKRGSKNGPTQS